jgi:hypothetical protein
LALKELYACFGKEIGGKIALPANPFIAFV